jgi:transposase
VFARKKRNASGSTSVQIIEKVARTYRVHQTLGSSRDPDEIERLFLEAQRIVQAPPPGTQWLFPMKDKEELALESFVAGLSNAQIRVVGPELIFGTLFERIGFQAIPEELFRHITIARLVYPSSKLKTIDYLYRYQGIQLSVDSIYRFMDRLNHRYQNEVGAIAYRHTLKRLGHVTVVFYDMTTLYFEAEDEDDLRRIGYSKDGKFQHPQIMLGLLVGEEGFPIGYDIYEGNTFEGHTLLPALERIEAKYGLGKPIVVADAALLSKLNIQGLIQKEYPFILASRIKNETQSLQATILQRSTGIRDGDGFVLKKGDGTRLVVTYSSKRARKDAANRHKGIEKLKDQIRGGRLTKESINNRGYNKFLIIEGKATLRLNEEKIKEDLFWDGLKGYVTNTALPVSQITDTYRHLWQIEKAFRISKTDLRVRPIYHYLRRRIEAHLCIAFAAYAIYKELEVVLKEQNLSMTPARAAELAHTMYELVYAVPGSRERKRQLLKMDAEQKLLYQAVCR